MLRKNILPRHSRRVALHVDTVLVPTILVRYQFRNAHGRRNALRSFRFQVRICTVTSSHIYNLGCREISRCCCREVRVEDNVRDSAMLKMFLFCRALVLHVGS